MTDILAWNASTLGMGAWRRWLTDHGSLTQRLRERCQAFRVQRLLQGTGRPYVDEAPLLGLHRGGLAVLREVLLLDADTPLVFAHTVIPLPGLQGPWQPLGRLGNRPLGAALFANPRVRRFPLAYRRLDQHHPLHRAAHSHAAPGARRLWARRSLFSLDDHPILVTEVFLPAVLQLP